MKGCRVYQGFFMTAGSCYTNELYVRILIGSAYYVQNLIISYTNYSPKSSPIILLLFYIYCGSDHNAYGDYYTGEQSAASADFSSESALPPHDIY